MSIHDTVQRSRAAPLTRGGPLDALRFVAAFCMVVYHYGAEAPVGLPKLHPVFERGYLATDFFLVVSGYVMGRIYGERVAGGRMSSGAFFLRRAARVIPAHLMVCAAFVFLVIASRAAGIRPLHPEWLDWRELPAQVALVQAWGPWGGKGWNAPSWTLSALLGCYFAFPTLWRSLRRLQSPIVAFVGGLTVLAVSDVTAQALLGYPIYQMPMAFGLVRAAPLFFLGCCLALCSERAAIPPVGAVSLTVGALAGLAAAQALGRSDFLSLVLVALLVLGAGSTPMRRPSKLLERAALVSFALFITNELVRVVYFGVDHVVAARLHLSQDAEWATWFGGLGAAVAAAVAFHYLVDQPSQARLKAWLGARGLGERLRRLLPAPDPDYDPFRGGRRPPVVREVLLDVGPRRGTPRRSNRAAPSEVRWG